MAMLRQIFVVLFLAVIVRQTGEAAPLDKSSAKSHELADALVTVKGDTNKWFGGPVLLALASELGITEERFRQTHPGAELEKLPAVVLATLRHGSAGIPTWIDCLDDQRATGVIENDLFNGGSSKDAKPITCGDAAGAVIALLVPSGKLHQLDGKGTEDRSLVKKAASEWHERLLGMAPEQRMKAWYEAADESERRLLLALAIQTSHAPAYPTLEASFLERAKKPDDFLYLELSAYFRHRRAAGKKLYEQVLATMPKPQPGQGRADDRELFAAMWKLLTDYDTLEPAINDWLTGKLPLGQLSELLTRSTDAPWAYHSMGIEPASVFRPTQEQNLRALVAAASREQDADKREALLSLGSEAASNLVSIIDHINPNDRLPPPRSDAEEWQPVVAQLRALFRDNRQVLVGDSITSPAEQAAEIVWDLWGPKEQTYDATTETYLRDWRREAFFRFDGGSCRSLLVPAAEEFISRPSGVKSLPYPEQEASALAREFADGDALAWRKKLEPMRWDRQLLLQSQAKKDSNFANHIWSRLVEFVDWTGASPGEPKSFEIVWRDKIAGRKLDESTWRALQSWLISEANDQRYWTIVAESHPVRPGITVNVHPTKMLGDTKNSHPVLLNYIRSGGLSLGKKESFQIVSNKLHEFVLDDEKDNQDRLRPLAAITERLKGKADDQLFSDRGFVLRMIVLPPRK